MLASCLHCSLWWCSCRGCICDCLTVKCNLVIDCGPCVTLYDVTQQPNPIVRMRKMFVNCLEIWSHKSCKTRAVAEVWRSYRLGERSIIDVRPSAWSTILIPPDMASGVRLLRPQVSAVSTCARLTRTIGAEARYFSLFTRPKSTYDEHVPLTPVGRLGLAISSGIGAFLDPRKGGACDMMIRD